ncbi:unnamed protein product, partial [marine sediment metagenome]
MIIEARLAVINFNPEKKRKLYPATPVSPRAIINKNCWKLIRGNLPYFLKTNKIKKKEANRNRKKAEIEEKPVGYALYFYNFSTFVGRPGLYIEDVFVSEEYRGQGIG